METPNLILSFVAGLLSFLSPCVFPLVPIYIGYLSGPAVMAARSGTPASGSSAGGTAATMSVSSARWTIMAHASLFVVGLILIYGVVFGGVAGALSNVLRMGETILFIQRTMGALLIVFGLHSIGLINVPIFNYTRHMDIRGLQNLGYLKSLLIGMAFAFGLGPCTSFQLGLILTMAISDPLSASLYFLIYGLGLGVPFLVVGMAMGQISKGMKKLTRRSYSLKIGSWTAIDKVNIVSLVSGIILVIMGLLAITDTLKYLSTIQLPWATPEL